MKKISTVIIICVLCFSTFSILAPRAKTEIGSWATKASLPQPLAVEGVAAANGRVYAIGGQYVSGGSFVWLNTNYEYDPLSDNWVSKASMPTARSALAAVSVNDKIYAIGGAASTSGGAFSTNEEFDPASNSWTIRAPMPTPRDWISAAAVNGKVYVIDGSDNSGSVMSTNEMYDPLTNTWTTKNPDPQVRVACGIGVVNGKIYLMGGIVQRGNPTSDTTLNEEYDPQTDTWSTKAPMPTARSALTVAVVNDKIYAIGGATDFNIWTNNLNVVEEYDPSTDTWITVQAMPTSRSVLGAAAVNNKFYSIGGIGSTGYLDTNEEFSGASGLVGYWKFDEGSGNIARDSSGNGNDGTVSGASWTNGLSSGALQFDGINDYVGVPSSPSLCVTGSQISVQLWMKPAVTLDANTPITNILDKGDEYGFQMDQYSSGRIWFFVWLEGAPWQGIQTTTSRWEANSWYLLTGTYDGSSLKVYVNGVLENSRPLSNGLYTSGYPLAIGSYCLGTKNFFNGAMDEVKIYSYARTAVEIQEDCLLGARVEPIPIPDEAPPKNTPKDGDINGDWKSDWLLTREIDDQGNHIEVWVVDPWIGAAYYALVFIDNTGHKYWVGQCVWHGGRNSAMKWHSGDMNKNGVPDLFLRTKWTTLDGPDDNPVDGKTDGLEKIPQDKTYDDDKDGQTDTWEYIFDVAAKKLTVIKYHSDPEIVYFDIIDPPTVPFNFGDLPPTDLKQHPSGASCPAIDPLAWTYVFRDWKTTTQLRINVNDKTFQFITPNKDFGIKGDPKMLVASSSILIGFKDGDICLIAMAIVKNDFCSVLAIDVHTRKIYTLLDKCGIE